MILLILNLLPYVLSIGIIVCINYLTNYPKKYILHDIYHLKESAMTQLAKVFLNGRSQAIRIPKDFRVDSTEVYIEKVGDTLIITPKKKNHWDALSETLAQVDTSDFMQERVQPPLDKREDLF